MRRVYVFLAHAFGQRYELPIPLVLFVVGGAAVVLASFLVIAPQKVGAEDGAAPPDRVAVRGWHPAWGTGSLIVLLALITAGVWGSQGVAENIVPTTFWLLVWIAVPLSCGLIGDWTRPVNPFAFLAGLTDRPGLRRAVLGGEAPVSWPSWLGWWPAVALFFVVACGELVFNLTATVPANTALGLLGYAVLCAVGGLLFGPAWLEHGEVFTVLFDTWGRLGWFRFGAPGRRGFAGGLDVPFATTPSRIVFVLMLLVSVNFDGLLATPGWNRLERQLPGQLGVHRGTLEIWRTGAFVLLALVVAGVFGWFALAAGRAGGRDRDFRTALAGLLPSLLPIAFGYLLAHNLQYLLVNGQLMLPLLGDPVGLDSWPIHLPYPFNDTYEPTIHLAPSALYWYVSLVVIIVVHVIAVVLAHRHLGRRGSTERAARVSEYPWLAAMVAYTMLSLWLLAQPLVKEKPSGNEEAARPAASASVGVARWWRLPVVGSAGG
jgi:hypothetical protein